MKKQICMMMAAMMAAAALTGCSGGAKETTAAPTAAKTAAETTQAPAAGEETEAESLAGETMAAQAGESAEILVAAAASLKNVLKLLKTRAAACGNDEHNLILQQVGDGVGFNHAFLVQGCHLLGRGRHEHIRLQSFLNLRLELA